MSYLPRTMRCTIKLMIMKYCQGTKCICFPFDNVQLPFIESNIFNQKWKFHPKNFLNFRCLETLLIVVKSPNNKNRFKNEIVCSFSPSHWTIYFKRFKRYCFEILIMHSIYLYKMLSDWINRKITAKSNSDFRRSIDNIF